MRRIRFLSLLSLGFLTSLSTTGVFAGDDTATLRCEPKPPLFECGTPTPTPEPKPTPVVRDHRHPVVTSGPIVRDHRKPVVTSGPIVRDHRDPVVNSGPIIRDHRDPVVASGPIVRDHRHPEVATGPTIRDHRKPRKPKDPIVSGPYHVPPPVYTPHSVDTSHASGGVVVTNTPKAK